MPIALNDANWTILLCIFHSIGFDRKKWFHEFIFDTWQTSQEWCLLFHREFPPGPRAMCVMHKENNRNTALTDWDFLYKKNDKYVCLVSRNG